MSVTASAAITSTVNVVPAIRGHEAPLDRLSPIACSTRANTKVAPQTCRSVGDE